MNLAKYIKNTKHTIKYCLYPNQAYIEVNILTYDNLTAVVNKINVHKFIRNNRAA